MEISKLKNVHLVGIKGVGMTALALCLQDLGIKITGSDIEEVFVTDEILAKRNLTWQKGFNGKNLPVKVDLVITTGAHGGLENPEVLVSQKRNIPVLTHAEALGLLMEGKEGISVCGVGGKTTTSSMIATILDKAGLYPSFAVGAGDIPSLGVPGRYAQKSRHFVAEADEYAVSPGVDNRPRFVFQKPRVVVMTNVEHDHPDIYPGLESIEKVFKEFANRVPDEGMVFACLDNKNIQALLPEIKSPVQTYGFSPKSDWVIERAVFSEKRTFFNLRHKGVDLGEFVVKAPGKLSILNATAAVAVGVFLGLDIKVVKQGLLSFTGVKRRFEFIGEAGRVQLYDDYAHHPVEIKATLLAARQWFSKRRLLVVFQPHTYSRTKALFEDFAQSFKQADFVFLAEIYSSAREKKDPTVSSKILSFEIMKNQPNVFYTPGKERLIEELEQIVKPGDIVLTMGAGDIFHWHKEILKILQKNE